MWKFQEKNFILQINCIFHANYYENLWFLEGSYESYHITINDPYKLT